MRGGWIGILYVMLFSMSAMALEPVQRPEEEMLLLAPRIGDVAFEEVMEAWLDESGAVYVPLGMLASILELPVETDTERGVASGWIGNKKAVFVLDIGGKKLIVNGHKRSLPSKSAELHEDDIYVRTDQLGKWWGIDIGYELNDLALTIRPSPLIPVYEKRQREQLQEALRERQGARKKSGKKNLPLIEQPYRVIGWPRADVALSWDSQRTPAQGWAHHPAWNMLGTGDVGYLSSEWFLAGQPGGVLDTARLRFDRTDEQSELLGSVRARTLSFGDVDTPSINNLSGGGTERGVTLSNQPEGFAEGLDTVTLTGNAQPGWQAELYRNDELLDFQTVGSDGRYRFPDVPLLYGQNLVRIVFYGPGGQRQEEIRRYNVNESRVPKGKSYWRLDASQAGEQLLPSISGTSVATGNVNAGQERLFSQYQYGISDQLSLSGVAAHVPVAGEEQSYAGVGLRSGYGGLLSGLDTVRNMQGGQAYTATLWKELGSVDVRTRYDWFHNFVSEIRTSPLAGALEKGDVSLNGIIPETPWLPRIPATVTALYEEYSSGAVYGLAQRFTLPLQTVLFTHSIETRFAEDSPETMGLQSSLGSIQMVGRIATDWRVTGQASYGAFPRKGLQLFSVAGEYQASEKTWWRLGADHQFDAEGQSVLRGGYGHDFRKFRFGSDVQVDSAGAMNLVFSIGFALGMDTQKNHPWMRRDPLTETSDLTFTPFFDRNNNGQREAEEQALQGIELGSAYGDAGGISNRSGQGHVVLPASNQPVTMSVAEGDKVPAHWRAGTSQYAVESRRGGRAHIDIPLIETGAVDGYVFLERNGKQVPVSAAVVVARDSKGKVIQKTTSEFDGFYTLDSIPLEAQRLCVSMAQKRRKQWRGGCQPVNLRQAEEFILSDINLIVTPTKH